MSAKEEKAKAPGKKPAERSQAKAGSEPPARRNYLSALATNVPGLAKLALGKRGFAEADLVGRWAEIVGADIARLAIPARLRLPRQKAEPRAGAVSPNVAGGTLTLRTSAAASLEIQHLKPRILERITTYFGYPAITDIRLEIGERKRLKPARRPAPPAAPLDLSGVSDPDIRDALQRLGTARNRRN